MFVVASSANKHAHTADSCIQCGSIRFSKDRVALTRNDKRVSSFARNETRWIRIGRDSASDQPLREFVWALGLGIGAFFLFRTAASGETGHLAAAVGLSLLPASASG